MTRDYIQTRKYSILIINEYMYLLEIEFHRKNQHKKERFAGLTRACRNKAIHAYSQHSKVGFSTPWKEFLLPLKTNPPKFNGYVSGILINE